MKRAAGFTLIELVIVIVILGILGAVAAPRFLSLQDEAYAANVNSLRSSIQSAMTLSNTFAVLKGGEKGAAEAAGDVVVGEWTPTEGEFKDVKFIYGFPAAEADGIVAALQGLDAGPDTDDKASSKGITYNENGGTITFWPSQRYKQDCKVEYTQATATTPALLDSETTGCE